MMSTEEFIQKTKEALLETGIEKNDILYVASDITSFLYKAYEECNVSSPSERNALLDELVSMFIELVGPEGTLLFPVFSWDFCRGKGFDIRKTKGEVGALNNWIMTHRSDFKRTRHPMYSFMVWGKRAEELLNMDNQDGWGEASPFTFLKNNNGKQLMFNIEAYQGLTFGHYVEQCVRVPYRHLKYFFGHYVNENGVDEIRMYSMCVRDLDVSEEIAVTNEFLVQNKVAQQSSVFDNTFTLIELTPCFDIIRNDIVNNNGKNTLKFTDYELDWSKEQTVPYEISKIIY